jgi:dihydrofolate reductase
VSLPAVLGTDDFRPARRSVSAMSLLRYSASISLDGFVAGPDQSPPHPLGVGGERLHVWLRELAAWRRDAGMEGGVTNASTAVYEADGEDVGAIIMGRNMFGGGPGAWDDPPWNGWWGEEPPFHMPVFVLTHHPRPPLECRGGTTFTFVTGGPEAALDLARTAAGERDIAVSGGAGVAQQFMRAGLVDELAVHLVPALLGDGVRLFDGDGIAALGLEQVRVVEAPGVTHLTYRSVA